MFFFCLLCADKRAPHQPSADDFGSLAQMRFLRRHRFFFSFHVEIEKRIVSKVLRVGGSPTRARLLRTTKKEKRMGTLKYASIIPIIKNPCVEIQRRDKFCVVKIILSVDLQEPAEELPLPLLTDKLCNQYPGSNYQYLRYKIILFHQYCLIQSYRQFFQIFQRAL